MIKRTSNPEGNGFRYYSNGTDITECPYLLTDMEKPRCLFNMYGRCDAPTCILFVRHRKGDTYDNRKGRIMAEPILKICARCGKITWFCRCNFGWYPWRAAYVNVFELIRDQFLLLTNRR